MTEPIIRDLAWPLSLAPGGRERTVVQGGLLDVQQGVDMLFTVPEGHLLYDQSFGRPDLAFNPQAGDAIERTIVEQAPRVGSYRVDGDLSTGFSVVALSTTAYPESA